MRTEDSPGEQLPNLRLSVFAEALKSTATVRSALWIMRLVLILAQNYPEYRGPEKHVANRKQIEREQNPMIEANFRYRKTWCTLSL